MFGMSPTKILFTVAIIAVVWYGFKWLGRYQAIQKRKAKEVRKDTTRSEKAAAESSDVDYEELVACAKCGDFVVADKKKGCGKEACPYDK